MSKKKRDDFEDQMRVYRGVIPWSVAEYDWVVATFDLRRPHGIEGLLIPEEYPELKDELKTVKGEELENIKDIILFSDIFRKRYPKKLEYDAHTYRFNQINKFLITHEDELVQLKLIYVKEDKKHVDPPLMQALCTMLFDEEDFDETGEWVGNTFSFEDAIAQTQAKINKKPSNKRLTEEQGFNGLIPWTLAEFRWVMNEHAVRGLNSEEKRTLEDHYLSLKIQMRRQTGTNIDNFDTMVLLNEIFHERYSNHIEAMAHFFRYRSIFMFVDEYKDQLIKEGLVDNASGELAMEPELIESLCVLPYSLEQDEKATDKKHTFFYKEVVAKAKALRSARLN
jgi:hypothetical protein